MKIFITGISSGIGKALAGLLLQRGHEVWGVARREALLEKLSGEAGYGKLHWSVCDVGDRKQVMGVRLKMKEKNFIPQACILNAGVSRYDLEAPLNADLTGDLVNANFNGVINCVDLFSRDIQQQQGQFILISSIFARFPDGRNPAYAASKAASSMLIRSLRLNEKMAGITFKNIYLGPVQTEMDREGKMYIPTVEDTANFLADRVIPARKSEFYYPVAARLACTLSLLLPGTVFNRLTATMRRK